MWRVIRPGLAIMVALPVVAIAGCGRSVPPHAAQTWDEAALQMPPGIAPQEMPDPDSRGAALTREYCSGCHGVPSPASHAAEDWVPTARRMFLRMEHAADTGSMRGMMGRGGPSMMSGAGTVPTPAEQDEIVAYLRDHALRSIDPSAVRNAKDPGAGLFARVCSRCHALPDPAQHTAAQWTQVVARMRSNMLKMHASGISDAQAQEIDSYLQGAGSVKRQGDN